MNLLRVFMRSYLHQENACIVSKTERRCNAVLRKKKSKVKSKSKSGVEGGNG
ncbi:MAG: hypothetical protein J6R63_06240 [Kiritimatiellae bacterium]|nr:hypothetical protein [Kiritimatiellia bacterium]